MTSYFTLSKYFNLSYLNLIIMVSRVKFSALSPGGGGGGSKPAVSTTEEFDKVPPPPHCQTTTVFFLSFATTLVDLLFIELMLHLSHVKQMYS